MGNGIYIDGFGPVTLIRPDSVAQLGEVIRAAADADLAIYPIGGATTLDLGNPPARPGHAVDVRGFSRIVDFPARDMTVTVQAGMTVAQLQETLAAENLRLPIDVPNAESATVGGIVAANVSGPRRLGFGTLRDYVIGISAVNDEGREFKAGGRVVKNVAGYDLCKLLVGSLGTLGIITQVTFKLRPLAEENALVALTCEPERLEGLLDRIHASRTRPVALEALNARAASIVFGELSNRMSAAWVLVAGYEGNHANVEWQMSQLKQELGDVVVEVRRGRETQLWWRVLTEFAFREESRLIFKANLVPSAVARFCLTAERLTPQAAIRAHAGNGIVVGNLTGEWTCDRATAVLAEWRDLARPASGRVIVARCPPQWKSVINVWGPIGGDAWLMRQVKEKFDPRGIFNPGRYYHGI